MAIISWNKKYGETLKVTLERFRTENPEYSDAKITYAGRLDPMAEGLVLLLTDEDVHRKDEFLDFDKTYYVDFILGMNSDTYDLLGIISPLSSTEMNEELIVSGLERIKNLREQKYPVYSSKTVEGKPLWQWEREGKISMIDIPKRFIHISELNYNGYQEISSDKLRILIQESIQLVVGDFRQQKIQESWEHYFKKYPHDHKIYSIEVRTSSGTYMRGLVHTLGAYLGVGATTLKITRTRIGSYPLDV